MGQLYSFFALLGLMAVPSAFIMGFLLWAIHKSVHHNILIANILAFVR